MTFILSQKLYSVIYIKCAFNKKPITWPQSPQQQQAVEPAAAMSEMQK